MAIDVVDRGAQTAIDDITVDVGDAQIKDAVTAVSSLEGVAVEDIRQRQGWRMTRATMLLEAARLIEGEEQHPLGALVELLVDGLGADWAAVTQTQGFLLAAAGAIPDPTWIKNFSTGLAFSGERGAVGDGVVFEPIADGALIVCRSLPEFLGREVDEIEGWAAIAGLLRPDHASRAPSPGLAAAPGGPGLRSR